MRGEFWAVGEAEKQTRRDLIQQVDSGYRKREDAPVGQEAVRQVVWSLALGCLEKAKGPREPSVTGRTGR